MTGPEHYRQAENLLRQSESFERGTAAEMAVFAEAQVHAHAGARRCDRRERPEPARRGPAERCRRGVGDGNHAGWSVVTVPAMTVSDLQARVDRGVAYLDRTDPGWWRTDLPDGGDEQPRPINLDELSMKDPCRCVFGHRLGNYYRLEMPLDEAVACGFDTAAGHSTPITPDTYEAWQAAVDDEFEALTELWRQVIERRRAEAGP